MKTGIFLALLMAYAAAAVAALAPAVRGERLAREHAEAHALRVALHLRLAELRH